MNMTKNIKIERLDEYEKLFLFVYFGKVMRMAELYLRTIIVENPSVS